MKVDSVVTGDDMNNENEFYMAPLHPGEVLLEEFMAPMGISQNRLAREIKVPPGRINEIVKGTRNISADTALRLSIYFQMSPEFWLNLQSKYDIEVAKDKDWDNLVKGIVPYEPTGSGVVSPS